MPACDHCGRVVARIQENNNGRTKLRLCPMCQAEFDLKHSPELRPDDLARASEPWYRRWWRKLTGG
ncbi:MAG: hypothetical protein J0I12_15170 [Candidatus Eremiobacteraeota bacterium]|nr:hypothetical protein [Candidatus Eremiobacteraeota bacterium]